MEEIKRSRKLPHLSDYIARELVRLKQNQRSWWSMPMGWLGAVGSAVGLGTLLMVAPGPLGAKIAAGFCAGLPVFFGILAALDLHAKKPRTAQEQALARSLEVASTYATALNEKRLHNDLDYTSQQLLEASAFHWNAIHHQLSEPIWAGEDAALHLRAVREEVLTAADEGMREALALCLRTLAGKGERKNRVGEILEDLSELDFESALEGFRQSVKGKNAYQSPYLREIFEPVKAIAERLKALSSEVEKMTSDARMQVALPENRVKSNLDQALRSLQELHTAQKELEEMERIREQH